MTAPGHAYGVGVVDDHCTGRFIWMMPSRSVTMIVVVTVKNDKSYKEVLSIFCAIFSFIRIRYIFLENILRKICILNLIESGHCVHTAVLPDVDWLDLMTSRNIDQ